MYLYMNIIKRCAPFIMADINAPVVRKSNALFNYRYGDQVCCSELQYVAVCYGAMTRPTWTAKDNMSVAVCCRVLLCAMLFRYLVP